MGLATTALATLGVLVLFSATLGRGYPEDAGGKVFRDTKMAIRHEDRGNKVEKKAKLLNLLKLKLKLVFLVVMLPLFLGLALLMAFKGIAISIISLVATLVLGLKNNVGSKHHQDDITYTHKVILAKSPGYHEQWWRRVGGDFQVFGKSVEPVIPVTGMASS